MDTLRLTPTARSSFLGHDRQDTGAVSTLRPRLGRFLSKSLNSHALVNEAVNDTTRTAVATKVALHSLFTRSGATRSPRTLPTLFE